MRLKTHIRPNVICCPGQRCSSAFILFLFRFTYQFTSTTCCHQQHLLAVHLHPKNKPPSQERPESDLGYRARDPWRRASKTLERRQCVPLLFRKWSFCPRNCLYKCLVPSESENIYEMSWYCMDLRVWVYMWGERGEKLIICFYWLFWKKILIKNKESLTLKLLAFESEVFPSRFLFWMLSHPSPHACGLETCGTFRK